jgi:uncharacterized surface protein with fasciclin (FAS1) repeats
MQQHQQSLNREFVMKKRSVILGLSLAATVAFAAPALAAVMVGGAAMYPSKNIVQNAVHSKAHTTLVAAVKQAGLVDTLEGPGPFTVFAPTNSAFGKLPHATVASLMQPANVDQLKTILTYHVLPGVYTTKDLHDKIQSSGGKAMINSVQGEPLTFTEQGGHIIVTDVKGDMSRITIGNVMQSNGVIQVVDTVLLP